jgi:hypothetical protein
MLGGVHVVCLRRRGHLGDHQAGRRIRWPAREVLASVTPRAPSGRTDLHQHFLAVVQRGIVRADQEAAELRARLRPAHVLTNAEQRRLHSALVDPRRGR